MQLSGGSPWRRKPCGTPAGPLGIPQSRWNRPVSGAVSQSADDREFGQKLFESPYKQVPDLGLSKAMFKSVTEGGRVKRISTLPCGKPPSDLKLREGGRLPTFLGGPGSMTALFTGFD
jgi:hypothetical protein